MSVQITLEILGATQDELKAFDGKLPKVGKLSFRPQKDSLLFWRRKGFEIKGVGEGVAESASAKSDYWPINAEFTKDLVEILSAFTKMYPRRFTLYAAFSGDLPKRDTEVQVSELLELIAGGHLGNRVKYQVRPDPRRTEAEPLPDQPSKNT